ncbi:hypothetical protein ID866_4393 [Astraeus odoratus]|nr:hypothetical protein ID866_4393 [Astraeus odoratus]
MSSQETDSESDKATPPPAKRLRHSSGANFAGNAMVPAATSDMNNTANLPPLSVSILGVEPLDDFIREIADFVHRMITTRPNMGPDARVEVEAKVGILKDKASNRRLALPVLVETILASEGFDLRFESNMSIAQHKHFNTLLNNLQQTSLESSHSSSPLEYKHLRLVDSFYASDNPRDREKIRVTREEQSGTVLEVTKKIRIGDLNIYSPKRLADWRVSFLIR